jgi:S-adenosylmethionine synthetase
MGRKSEFVKKTFIFKPRRIKDFEVELFTWEKLDYVEKIK